MTTFIDTNVLISLVNDKEIFHKWSVEQLQNCKAKGPVIVSDIVYCEFSTGMSSKDDVDTIITGFDLERFRAPDAALFRAAKAFKDYKETNKGPKTGVLPDFLIGATAVTMQASLLTANSKDFIGYFPDLKIIAP